MDVPAAQPKWIRPAAAIGIAIYSCACALSIAPALMSPMLFDAPGSDERTLLWLLMGVLLLLPVDLFCAIIALVLAGWKLWRTVTLVALVTPVLHALAIVGLFALM